MEDMIEIARLISQVGLIRPDSILSSNESSLISDFFNGLAVGEISSDEEAAMRLYNSSPSDERYRKLKLRIREKLYDTSVFINFAPPKFSTYRQKTYECLRELISMKQCVENGAHKAGVSIAKQLLKKARKFHQTSIEIECLYVLHNHIITSTGNVKDREQICVELEHAQYKQLAETQAEMAFGSISILYATVHADHPENTEKIKNCIRKMESILENFDTYKIRYNYYLLKIWLTQAERNLPARILACDDAIDYLKVNPDIAGNLVALFSLEKAECYFNLRNYQEYLNIIHVCESSFLVNTNNWLILKNYQVLALLCIGDSIGAYEVFTTVAKSLVRSSGGVGKFNEQWLIIEGYIYFFLHTTNSALFPESFHTPSLEKYIRKLESSEFYILAKDKEGANVGLLVIRMLLMLCSKKSNSVEIIEKILLLERYKLRNLDEKSNYRTVTFIKLLRNFIFAYYENHKTVHKSRILLHSLVPNGDGSFIPSEDYELIPYDIVWKRLMQYYGVDI